MDEKDQFDGFIGIAIDFVNSSDIDIGILKVVGALQQRGMLDQVTNLCLHCMLF